MATDEGPSTFALLADGAVLRSICLPHLSEEGVCLTDGQAYSQSKVVVAEVE